MSAVNPRIRNTGRSVPWNPSQNSQFAGFAQEQRKPAPRPSQKMPISSGASGRRPGLRSASASTARSTPNLAAMQQQQQQQQQQPAGRMIDAPPKVESRRQMGSQTLYGSRPPWATDDDASSPQPQQQPQQQPQPPFYPAGSDLPHGEAARMRRLKAARQIYKSPQSRHQHTTTGSVDDLLRDCAISDHSHSHSPSPVRRTPSASSSLAARSTSDLRTARSVQQPGTRNASVGTDTLDSHLRNSEPNLLRSGSRRSRRNRRSDDDNGSVSDDSLDDGCGGRIATASAAATGTNRGSGRGRRRTRTSRGTSPPPTPPPPRPLYVDTGCDPEPQEAHLRGGSGGGGGFGRTKLAPGLKPASERRYVPPPPLPQSTQSQPLSTPVVKHDCLPTDHPPFRARPMPDFSGGASPAPIRQPRSRSQSPAAVAPWRAPTKMPEVAGLSSTTSGYRSGGSGGSPQQPQGRHRHRSMDEDSLTEASSAGGREDFRARLAASSVSTEVLRPQRAQAQKREDAVDSTLRKLDQQPAASSSMNPSNSTDEGHRSAQFLHLRNQSSEAAGHSFSSLMRSCSTDSSTELNRSLLDANQSESDMTSSPTGQWETSSRWQHQQQPMRREQLQPGDGSSEMAAQPQQPQSSAHSAATSWCQLCQKKVYPLEMFAWGDSVYHKSCFRCHTCRQHLSTGSFSVLENRIYCLAHYLEQLRLAGDSNTNFAVNGTNEKELEQKLEESTKPQPQAKTSTVVFSHAPANSGHQLSADGLEKPVEATTVQRADEQRTAVKLVETSHPTGPDRDVIDAAPTSAITGSLRSHAYSNSDSHISSFSDRYRHTNSDRNRYSISDSHKHTNSGINRNGLSGSDRNSMSDSHRNSKMATKVRQLVEAHQQRSFDVRLSAPTMVSSSRGGSRQLSENIPAPRRESVARESDVNDFRPERGTARSLLDMWREREAAAARPDGWAARKEKQESDLLDSNAARSALRLWQDKEVEAARTGAWRPAMRATEAGADF